MPRRLVPEVAFVARGSSEMVDHRALAVIKHHSLVWGIKHEYEIKFSTVVMGTVARITGSTTDSVIATREDPSRALVASTLRGVLSTIIVLRLGDLMLGSGSCQQAMARVSTGAMQLFSRVSIAADLEEISRRSRLVGGLQAVADGFSRGSMIAGDDAGSSMEVVVVGTMAARSMDGVACFSLSHVGVGFHKGHVDQNLFREAQSRPAGTSLGYGIKLGSVEVIPSLVRNHGMDLCLFLKFPNEEHVAIVLVRGCDGIATMRPTGVPDGGVSDDTSQIIVQVVRDRSVSCSDQVDGTLSVLKWEVQSGDGNGVDAGPMKEKVGGGDVARLE
ncbi:hypothetical protein NE237_022189 [Protea cynaroides]|uniref:Uncharacterized protein n=1 Tax=Protea cynaroides TaxID=273540 RepID=A0A9Q0HAH2_9MAGN|nr:hypothetical protein NE237_022189 [Protea cynaroides]